MNVSIVAGTDTKSSSVSVSGSVQHVITDDERGTFKLHDSQLKSAVNAYFGKSPNDAYLKSPTPWNDLYKTYGWQQVTTTVRPISAQILEITSNPVAIRTQVFENNSSREGTFNIAISDSVTNTTTSSWSVGGEFSVGQEIEYGIKFLGTGVSGTTDMSYSQSWGKGGEESKSIEMGSTTGVEVVLKPGEAVKATLSASLGSMKVRIRYQASLSGYTAVNYNPTYRGHHFWALPISSVMSSASMNNGIVSTEDIDIGYYAEGHISIEDVNISDPATKAELDIKLPLDTLHA